MMHIPPTQITQAEYEKIKPLLYHTVTPDILKDMTAMRVQYIHTALAVLRNTDYSRSQSLSLTYVEESAFRAIQSSALKGVAQLPPEFEVVS